MRLVSSLSIKNHHVMRWENPLRADMRIEDSLLNVFDPNQSCSFISYADLLHIDDL